MTAGEAGTSGSSGGGTGGQAGSDAGGSAGGQSGSGGSAVGAAGSTDGSPDVSSGGDGPGDAEAGCNQTRGVIDFESLSHTGAFVALPRPYADASGFTLNCTSSMSVVGSTSIQYLNTTAIITSPTATVTLTRGDGKPFSLLKISLSTYNDVHPGVIYSFTGHKPDGSVTNVDVPLLTNGRGFVPYTPPSSFEGLSSVEWTMNTADNAQYFDDITFAYCP
jgi:hypothetical protein